MTSSLRDDLVDQGNVAPGKKKQLLHTQTQTHTPNHRQAITHMPTTRTKTHTCTHRHSTQRDLGCCWPLHVNLGFHEASPTARYKCSYMKRLLLLTLSAATQRGPTPSPRSEGSQQCWLGAMLEKLQSFPLLWKQWCSSLLASCL